MTIYTFKDLPPINPSHPIRIGVHKDGSREPRCAVFGPNTLELIGTCPAALYHNPACKHTQYVADLLDAEAVNFDPNHTRYSYDSTIERLIRE